MSGMPFGVNRGPLFTLSQLGRIEEAMIRILSRIGLKVHEEKLREAVRSEGFPLKGDRVLFDRGQIAAFLDAERARNGNAFGPEERTPASDPLTLGVSQYSQNCLDAETGRVLPFTSGMLVEATKLVDVLAERGVRAGAPGTPMDVHPDLQPVTLYRISLTYSRHGHHPPDPRSVRSLRYIMDMAECVNCPVRLLPVYLVSPLCLAGESLEAVLAFKDRIHTAWVLSMPSAGGSAPIRVGDAYAMSVAEVIGSAIVLREVTELEISWEIQMFPFDLRRLSMVFGSPENFLLQLASSEVNAFFHGTRWPPFAGNIHTMAKLPGPQAAAEKASLMTTGALLGARHFVHGGTLSLDEVFSAEQLVIDCEIKDHVERMVAGLETECDPESCESDVLEGVERGFMGLDSTVEHYRSAYWYPRLFERRLLGPWQEAGSPDIREQARQEVRRLLSTYDYALAPEVQREVDRIYARAEAELG